MPEKFYYILCCIVWIWQQCVIKLLKYFELWINVLCFMDGGKFSDNYEYQEIKFLGPLNCPSCKKPSSAESKYSDWLWVWDLSPAISTSLLCVGGFSLNPGCPDLGGLVLYWWLPASKTNHGFWYCTFVCRELYHELCIHTSSYISIYCGITRTRAALHLLNLTINDCCSHKGEQRLKYLDIYWAWTWKRSALDIFYLCLYQFQLWCERQCKVRWCNLWHWAGDLNTIGGQIRLFHNPHKPKHDVFMCFHNAPIVCEVLCSMQMMILRIASPSLRLLMVTSRSDKWQKASTFSWSIAWNLPNIHHCAIFVAQDEQRRWLQ